MSYTLDYEYGVRAARAHRNRRFRQLWKERPLGKNGKNRIPVHGPEGREYYTMIERLVDAEFKAAEVLLWAEHQRAKVEHKFKDLL